MTIGAPEEIIGVCIQPPFWAIFLFPRSQISPPGSLAPRYSPNWICPKVTTGAVFPVNIKKNSNHHAVWHVSIPPPSFWTQEHPKYFPQNDEQNLVRPFIFFVHVDVILITLIYPPMCIISTKYSSCSSSRVSTLAFPSVYSPFLNSISWDNDSPALVVLL